MAIGEDITRDEFLRMARAAGLDTDSPYMEELYPVVRATLRSLGSINQIDLTDAEPDVVYSPDPLGPG